MKPVPCSNARVLCVCQNWASDARRVGTSQKTLQDEVGNI